MRKEHDFLGEVELDDKALYGIHAVRAKNNFPDNTTFHIDWYKAIGVVKQAAYNTIENFTDAVKAKYPEKVSLLNLPNKEIIKALQKSAVEIANGNYNEHFIVPAIQGGAGTSINLNVNEIIANSSLLKLGHSPGNYSLIDPIEQANQFQSTNDVIPTALTVAAIKLLEKLELSINSMREKLEKLESEHRNSLRLAYTQMQQAVPSSFGQLFSAYNDAFSRDWWRVSKCFERIKTVNLGGGATGSGIAIPRFYIMEVVPELKKITGLPITQSENLTETTSNLDGFVEVHAMLKAHAVNLHKMVNDLRLLGSDIVNKEISLPEKQVGSSIMPGKVNPVIPEYIIAVCEKIFANDALITNLAAQGTLELNANIPTIGHALLESIKWLLGANKTIEQNMLTGIVVNNKVAANKLFKSPAVCTAISPVIGYNKATELANFMKEKKCDIFEANISLDLIDQRQMEEYMKPGFLLQKGFSVKDIIL